MSFIAGVLREAADPPALCSRILATAAGLAAPPFLNRESRIHRDLAFGLICQSSLPEDSFDLQPWTDGHWSLVGDVRLDNRAELQRMLGVPAAEFAAISDSHLFLLCWKKWEESCLGRLCGGFAVAIWDHRDHSLHLLRDHSGERPIYYAETHTAPDQGFAFASLPEALRLVPGVDGNLDEEFITNYLAMVPSNGAKTFFKGIHLLAPGHRLVYKAGETSIRQYWHPSDAPAIRYRKNEDYVEALLERFDLAVTARLRTTSRIGSQLSGGMDSSSVTATAARLLAPQELTAYTAIPQSAFNDLNPEGRFGNEGPAAALVAARYANIRHVLIEPSGRDLFQTLTKTSAMTNVPVFNPMNQMWLNGIFDDARARGISVILQGICGNATLSFGGLIGLSDLLRSGRWLTLVRQIRDLRAKGHSSWRGGAYWAIGSSLPMVLRRLLSPEIGHFNFAYSPVHPDRAAETNLKQRAFKEFFAADKSSADFRRKMFDYYDAGFLNAGVNLGWGISLRDPMQDKRIFEFCFATPIEQYLAEGQSRSMVRRAMRDRLPPEVLSCTTRGLQAADWYLTMGARLTQMQEELDAVRESPMAARVLDLDRLQVLLDTWPTSSFELPEVSDSWHLALMRGLAAGNFIRLHEKKSQAYRNTPAATSNFADRVSG